MELLRRPSAIGAASDYDSFSYYFYGIVIRIIYRKPACGLLWCGRGKRRLQDGQIVIHQPVRLVAFQAFDVVDDT